jgi:hypothetical protein
MITPERFKTDPDVQLKMMNVTMYRFGENPLTNYKTFSKPKQKKFDILLNQYAKELFCLGEIGEQHLKQEFDTIITEEVFHDKFCAKDHFTGISPTIYLNRDEPETEMKKED